MDGRFELLDEEVKNLSSDRVETFSSDSTPAKRIKRAENTRVAEAVRRLHNSENNAMKLDPKQSINSPHNLAVTTYMLEQVGIAFPDTDSDVITAACKTYFESLKRSHRLDQPENAPQKKKLNNAMKTRQRKTRLLASRARCVQTDAERAVWARATLDLMSEEEDGVVDGRAVWIVSPPPQRDEELSDLCQVLQQRKDKQSAGRQWLVFSSVKLLS
ncbi:uncharacterized protein C14orf93-like [Cololabis saira]|uniref:uncharacterized protein C14orf93-like n=1 Tax=Cololabis saira TaxID=129043 RepID=UPI002AD33EC1|nr:uncharacterized protein C14orf93-like [Cololabis saira]